MDKATEAKIQGQFNELNAMIPEIHQNAVEHGWWENPPTTGAICALIHSEISEALEEYRNDMPNSYFLVDGKVEPFTCPSCCIPGGSKPEGIAVELADAIIRVLDYYGYANDHLAPDYVCGWTYTVRDSFGDFICDCHAAACSYYSVGFYDSLVLLILQWAVEHEIDMVGLVRLKHAYNKGRPYRHGGKAL